MKKIDVKYIGESEEETWEEMYVQLPHYEKINGKWYYVHFGGDMISKVSEEKAKQLEKDRQAWEREWEGLAKSLGI